jgi:hypothetical protein
MDILFPEGTKTRVKFGLETRMVVLPSVDAHTVDTGGGGGALLRAAGHQHLDRLHLASTQAVQLSDSRIHAVLLRPVFE